LGNGTDYLFLQNLIKYQSKNTQVFAIQKVNNEVFIVKHTAMDVVYNTRGFRIKNKDEVPLSIETCIEESNSQKIVEIWRFASTYQQMMQIGAPETYNSKFQSQMGTSKKENKFLGAKFRKQIR
jgi:myosin heavy subunit